MKNLFIFFGLIITTMAHAFTQNIIRLKPLEDSVFYFTDKRDHNTYRAISFEGFSWMTEPLRYKTSDSWCYEGKLKNCRLYGRMYHWEDATNACPHGWRLPSNNDWDKLIDHLGGDDVAGLYFSESDTSNFHMNFGYPPNINGRFATVGTELHFWSVSEYNVRTGWQYYIIRDKLPYISSNYISKNYTLNCLCVKDEKAE